MYAIYLKIHGERDVKQHDRHVDNDHSLIITTNKIEDTIQTHIMAHFFIRYSTTSITIKIIETKTKF